MSILTIPQMWSNTTITIPCCGWWSGSFSIVAATSTTTTTTGMIVVGGGVVEKSQNGDVVDICGVDTDFFKRYFSFYY